MPVDIRDAVYSGIGEQFPSIYKDEGGFLVDFVKAYYEHFDKNNDRNIPKLRDIDTTLSTFLVYYKKKYLADLPLDSNIDVRFIIKHIQDMYKRKGTQQSLELLFQLFFNEDIEVFYPSTAVLRPSDSIWGGDAYLEMLPVYTVDDYPIKKGQRIKGDVSLATAFVDEVIFVNFGGALIPLVYLSNVAGGFVADDGLQVSTANDDGTESLLNKGRLIAGSVSLISIDVTKDRIANQKLGDKVGLISKKSGIEAEGRVTSVSETVTGTINFEIVDGGFGYVDPNSQSLVAKNDIGISNHVMVVKGDTRLDIEKGDIIIANGVSLKTSGSDDTDYAITGSGKVIDYVHPLVFFYCNTYQEVDNFVNIRLPNYSEPGLTNAPFDEFLLIAAMRNAQYAEYVTSDDSVTSLPLSTLPIEYSYYRDNYLKRNQYWATDITDSGANASNVTSLSMPYKNDSSFTNYNTGNPASTPFSAFGTNSIQAMREYLNVFNLSDNFPALAPTYRYYDTDDSAVASAFATHSEKWEELLSGVLLAFSKFGIFPAFTIATHNTSVTTQNYIINDRDYLIYDNGSGITNWSSYGATTARGVEGEVFTASLGGATQVNFPNPRNGLVVDVTQMTTEQRSEVHLNRLRMKSDNQDESADSAYDYRVANQAGTVISYPSSLSTPAFALERYRGDNTRFGSSGSDVYLGNIEMSNYGAFNDSAKFEVGAIENVETVTLIQDRISQFGDIQLDINDDGVFVGDDYGMSGPTNENLTTSINDAFSPITLKIGTISDLNIISPGLNYQNDAKVLIEHTNISTFNKKDLIVNFNNTNFDISVGDIVEQRIKIPDIQINQSGNPIHQQMGGFSVQLNALGCVATGTNYANSTTTFAYTESDSLDYTVKGKFIKRDGNDYYFRQLSFYDFQKTVPVQSIIGNTEYIIASKGNLSDGLWNSLGASSTPTVGEIFTSVPDSTILALKASNAISSSSIGSVSPPVIIGGSKQTLTLIKRDEDSAPMGANAEISAIASFQSGQIDEVAVTKTGYRYQDEEIVDVISLEPDNLNYNKKVAEAKLRVLGQGKTAGKWLSKTSFLSESSKHLHDNDYYQEYSYEISSIITPSRYESLIAETVGVAGTKLFSKPLINSNNLMDSTLNLEISKFNIRSVPFLTSVNISAKDIKAGETYTILSLGLDDDSTQGGMSVEQWIDVGAEYDNTPVVSPIGLEKGRRYVVADIDTGSWQNVKTRSEADKFAWWDFWFNVLGGNGPNGYFENVDLGENSVGRNALEMVRQVTGVSPLSDTFEAVLNTITTGLSIGNAYRYADDTTIESIVDNPPVTLSNVVFNLQQPIVGDSFVASKNGVDITGLEVSHTTSLTKVSYTDGIMVTPYWANEEPGNNDIGWMSPVMGRATFDYDGTTYSEFEYETNEAFVNGMYNINIFDVYEPQFISTNRVNITSGDYYIILDMPDLDVHTGASLLTSETGLINSPYADQINRFIRSWNIHLLGASSSSSRDRLVAMWNTYFDIDSGAVDLADTATYPVSGLTIVKGKSSLPTEESDYNDGVDSHTSAPLHLANITSAVVVLDADNDILSDGFTINMPSHGISNDTVVQYYLFGTGDSGLLTEPTTGDNSDAYQSSDPDQNRGYFYYVVNVTNNTFQLSRVPMQGADSVETAIDLSTMTGTEHLLVKHTAIHADQSNIISIQEL